MKNDMLRKSVIKYALEGKLSRRSNDNAGVLFETLAKAGGRINLCSRIIKEGEQYYEIVGKEKKDITEEIPFDIPNNWVWCRFEDICDFCIGKTPERKTSSYWDSNDIPWVSITDMKDNSHISKTKEFISIKAKNDCFSFEPCEPGSMLMSFKLTIGKTTIVDMPCYFNEAIMKFEPFVKNETFRSYLFMFIGFLSREIRVTDAIKGSTLNKKKLAKMFIPLPPICEQEEIMNKLHNIDPLLDEYELLEDERKQLDIDLPEKLRMSVLKMAVEGNLTKHNLNDLSAKALVRDIIKEKENAIKTGSGKKDNCLVDITTLEKPFEKPDNWEWIHFGDLGFLKKGPFGSDLTKSMFVEKGPNAIKVYEQQNAIKKNWTLGSYFIRKSYYDEKMYVYKVEPGDIIVSCAGTIGETYIVPDEAELGIINQALMRMKITKKINHDYFLLYFDFILKNSAKKESNGTAIKNIPPFDVLKNMLVAMPPLDEQNRIVETVNRIYSEIDSMVLDQ